MKKLNILYIVNFWGILPHNYFIKYLRENQLAEISTIVLPLISFPQKGYVSVDAFFIDKNGKKTSYQKKINFMLPHFFRLPLHYITNFSVAIKILIKNKRERFDICIGESSFNGMLALFIKKLGMAKHSIFVMVDALPNPNVKGEGAYLKSPQTISPPKILKILNRLVLLVQFLFTKLAYKNELVWFINDKIRVRNSKQGLVPKNFIISPGAIDPERVKRSREISKIENSVAYIGGLKESVGVDIAIKSLSIVKNKIKDFKFIVIGGDPYLVNYYTVMAKSYGIIENVKFYGYVPDFDDAIDIIASCKIGLALYKPKSTSMYTDVSKPKNYLQALLPTIIIKPGPDICKGIEAYQAGICVKYDEEQIAAVILDIFKNKALYNRLLRGVIALGEKFDYNNLCSTAFKDITSKLNIDSN